ncbi:MAG: NAD(P)-dependent alcohol dehydrogenase [Nannocystales bacterium]
MPNTQPRSMRAAIRTQYGQPEVLKIAEIDRPECEEDEVLVEVRSAAVNPYDWHGMTGTPYITRMGSGWSKPKDTGLGVDVSGVVTAVGAQVSDFAVGDEVFGCADGAYAEFVAAKADSLARKPANTPFDEAAAVPVAALAALQGLRDHGKLQSGQRVLVNGASGGVGTFAVQLAKHLGATVTGVCSASNARMVRSLGADHVVDYTTEDFTETASAYDVIFDNMGNRKMSEIKRCLSPSGCYVVVGGPKRPILGPLLHMIKAMVSFMFGSQRAAAFMTQRKRADLEFLADLLSAGALRSVVETKYPLDQVGMAMTHLATGHAKGKLVLQP